MGLKQLVIAAFMAPLLSAPALADEVRWTHRDGIFSLAPVRADARLLDGFNEETAVFQVGAEPVPVRMCAVGRERRIPGADNITQSQANDLLMDMMRAHRSSAELTITDRRSFDRDGVAVFATRVVTPSAIYHFWRFALATPSGATYHELNCGGSAPLTAAEEVALVAFLDSLQFSPSGTSP
jgi:hypothetical protein